MRPAQAASACSRRGVAMAPQARVRNRLLNRPRDALGPVEDWAVGNVTDIMPPKR